MTNIAQSMAMNALLSSGKQSGSSNHGSSSSPLVGLAGQFLGGSSGSNHGKSSSSTGKIVGQLASSFLSSANHTANKPEAPTNYHGGHTQGAAGHAQGGLAGSVMGGVANMFGGNKPGHSVRTFCIFLSIPTTDITCSHLTHPRARTTATPTRGPTAATRARHPPTTPAAAAAALPHRRITTARAPPSLPHRHRTAAVIRAATISTRTARSSSSTATSSTPRRHSRPSTAATGISSPRTVGISSPHMAGISSTPRLPVPRLVRTELRHRTAVVLLALRPRDTQGSRRGTARRTSMAGKARMGHRRAMGRGIDFINVSLVAVFMS